MYVPIRKTPQWVEPRPPLFVDDMFAPEGSVHYADPRDISTDGGLKSTPTDTSTHVHDVSNVAHV